MVSTTRKDFNYPAEPTEVLRFLLTGALTQVFEGPIKLYLPPAAEHADQIVNQSKPVLTTTILRKEEVI